MSGGCARGAMPGQHRPHCGKAMGGPRWPARQIPECSHKQPSAPHHHHAHTDTGATPPHMTAYLMATWVVAPAPVQGGLSPITLRASTVKVKSPGNM